MELRHLRCLVTVAEELHFARAAERLHIEQSSLSRAVKHNDLANLRREWIQNRPAEVYASVAQLLRKSETFYAEFNVAQSGAAAHDWRTWNHWQS